MAQLFLNTLINEATIRQYISAINMNLLILSDKPTQFDAPFYRYISNSKSAIGLHVLYSSGRYDTFDSELSMNTSWGIDLMSGYNKTILKSKNDLLPLFRLIKSSDFVIISGYSSLPCMLSYLFCFILNIRCAIRLDTVDWRNQALAKLNLYKKPLFAILNYLCVYFLACSSSTNKFLAMVNIKPGKIKRFPYIVDSLWFAKMAQMSANDAEGMKAALNIPSGNAVILIVSKLNNRENPVDIIESLKHLSNVPITVLIIGDGKNKADLVQLANTLPSTKQIIFLGYIAYSSLPLYYGIADLFVHPVQDEPWGVSVQEAMACNLPVITSNFVGAGYDLIQPGKNGFMYHYGDVTELAERIKDVLALKREDVIAANRTSLSRFSYETVWLELQQIITISK